MSDYGIPLNPKWTPFRKCEECGKRSITTTEYEVNDSGLMSFIRYNVCRKCQKEAKERAKVMNEKEESMNDEAEDEEEINKENNNETEYN